ncbi:deoxyguanosinetriphosphate triphosphohydrolase [Patescibacteria group bacterium]|nr:deoxyguanosinetriphosphate triphosphohydrolase [Patescibacteria group bacterium]
MLFYKEKLEELENKRLASYAMFSAKSEGRKFPENSENPENTKQDHRLCFQKDRDRIIHSKAFRRLEAKTQVFPANFGDHFRNRLTHTIEVAQISRDICRGLGLNEDLGESIALAHDLGHTPFGHVGEIELARIMQGFDMRFEHNEQSRRVIEKLEKRSPDFDGLNLTKEVLDGLIKHQTSWDNALTVFKHSPHLEAQVVNLADEIAYTNHDLDDGLRSKLITIQELEKLEMWQLAGDATMKKYEEIEKNDIYINRTISNLISYMVHDLYETSENELVKNRIFTIDDVKNFEGKLIKHSEKVSVQLNELRHFLAQNFYFSDKVKAQTNLGKQIVHDLFDVFYNEPSKLPEKHQKEIVNGEKKEVLIKDYIAGMTDNFAEMTWKRLNQ